MELPYDPEAPPLGIHLDKTTVQTHTFTPLFIAALFTIARPWKHLHVGQQMDGLRCGVCLLSHFGQVRLFETLWTVAHEAPLSMGFSRQEYWTGLSCPPPGDLPDPGIEPASPAAPAMQADSLPLSHLGSLKMWYIYTVAYYS